MRLGRRRGLYNWAGNQRCVPVARERPESTDEVVAIVRSAAERGLRVKAVGAGHSFTAAATTDGILVSLDGLARIQSIDDASGRALVGAGIRLRALNRELDASGRALPNLGDIDRQSVAGAIATGTHGTGIAHGNLSTGVTGIELVTGSGDVLWCDAEQNSEIWSAARVGLGALGIITRIELDTEPSFNLMSHETSANVDDLFADWDGFIESADHPELFWLPGTDRCLVKRNNRTSEERSAVRSTVAGIEKLLVENVAFGLAVRTARRFPSSRHRIAALIGAAVGESERIDTSFRIFATPRHVRFVEMEYGIPVAAVPEAFGRVRRLIAALPDPPTFPVEVRVSAADDIPLSTASGRASGWIAVHRYRGEPFEELFRGVETIMNDYDGRPHWGKYHYQSAETLESRYPLWAEFARVRNEVDPDRRFRNAYTDRVLG